MPDAHAAAPAPMLPSRYEVTTTISEAADTVTLDLLPLDEALPSPVPGQFNMLWVPGVGEVAISLAGMAGDLLTHTIRAVGAVTDALCRLQPGDQVGVRGPFGRGWGLDRAVGRDVLVVAGGLGLAPLRPLIGALAAEPDRVGSVRVLVGARTPDGLLYGPELDRWGHVVDVAVTVDEATPGWDGNVGPVTDLLPSGTSATSGRSGEIAFVCGPEIMMQVVADAVVARGTSPDDIEVSLERNMQCGVGHCGRCQLGPVFLCTDGPVVSWTDTAPLLAVRGR